MLEVYETELDVTHYRYFLVEDNPKGKTDLLSICGRPLRSRWRPPKMTLEDPKSRYGDFFHFNSYLPILSERAVNALIQYLGPNTEILPFTYESKTYYVINVLTVIDCLNTQKTGWDDEDPSFERPYFIPSKLKDASIFRIPQSSVIIWVRENFKQAVEEGGLKGLMFQRVWTEEQGAIDTPKWEPSRDLCSPEVKAQDALQANEATPRSQKPKRKTKREQLLTQIWENIIDDVLKTEAFDQIISEAKQYPDAPFADAGLALERILQTGVSRDDMARVLRGTAYNTVFSLLTMLEEAGPKALDCLHEDLLIADPTGREGRPPE